MQGLNLLQLRKGMLWISIALGLVLAVALFSSVKSSENHQLMTLSHTLKSGEVFVYNNLQDADSAFNRLYNQVSLSERAIALSATPQPSFNAVTLHLQAGESIPLYGELLPAPILNDAEKAHLEIGNTLIHLDESATPSKLHWLRRLEGTQNILVAELDQATLFANLPKLAETSDLFIINEDQSVIFSANTVLPEIKNQLMEQQSRFSEGEFSLNQENGSLDVKYQVVDLRSKYATADWVIVTSKIHPLLRHAVNQTHKILFALIVLLIGAYLGLSKLYSRNPKIPLTSSNKNNFESESDSVKELLESRDQLAREKYILAMSEIDRAILSNADFDKIIALLLDYANQVVPSAFVALSRLDKNLHQNPVTLIRFPDGTIEEHPAKREKSMRQIFDARPNGFWVTNPESIPFMKLLLNGRAQQFLAQPVYREGELSAILYFGLLDHCLPNDFEVQCAQHFANRLGVAKTSAIQEKELYQKEYFDTITNLFNRNACRDRLSQEMSRARRQQTKLATFYINLDGFKKVNDSLGYLIGDGVLKEVAERLKSTLREADVIARFGGDEFVIIISDVEKMGRAKSIAEKIYDLFSTPFTTVRNEVYLSASIGISIYPDDGITVDELIHHADSAMMAAKRGGHAQYAFYEENMSSREIWQAEMERELRLALARNELFMLYQPQLCGRTGKLLGVEALMRWKHPERGVIAPIEFIKIAEESGLIVQLGRYGRKTVCTQYKIWESEGIEIPSVALNVSAQEIQRKEFVYEIEALLKETGVPATKLELEITESVLIDDIGNVTTNLSALHKLGVRIAIDDFGTGYSNLSYLVRLPFDVLKVDKAFVQGVGKYSGSTQVVTMIIDMAHHLGKTVCAEGVENEMQKQFLVESGCESIQGYLLSKPLTAAQLEQYVIGEPQDSLLFA